MKNTEIIFFESSSTDKAEFCVHRGNLYDAYKKNDE